MLDFCFLDLLLLYYTISFFLIFSVNIRLYVYIYIYIYIYVCVCVCVCVPSCLRKDKSM